MRTFVKHGIVAAAFATLALACGGNNQPAQAPLPATAPQPAPGPSPENEPTEHTEAATHPQPQQPTLGTGGPQQPIEEPLPQKPLIGGVTPPASHVLAKTEPPLSEAQVVGAAMAVNKGEVEMADLALKKAASPEVKQFANLMVHQHGGSLRKEKTIEDKTKITGAESDVSSFLESEVSSSLDELRDKQGKDFDRAYIESQVKAHRDALMAIDNRLMPSATNAAVKDQLRTLRRQVAEHLAKAEAIEKKMGIEGGTERPGAGMQQQGPAQAPGGTRR